MTQSAMSSTLDLKWELLSDSESEEWVLFPDGFDKGDVNDSSSKLTTCEIAKQTLHDIEDLGRKDDDYWLDEFRLFEEIQSLSPAEDFPQNNHLIEECEIKSNQHQISPNDGSIGPETQNQTPNSQKLFPVDYENATTFILSGENVLYFNIEPSVSFPLNTEPKLLEEITPVKKTVDENINVSCQSSPTSEEDDVTMRMEIIDEILRNKAQELDHWESDTYRSETSSDSSSNISKLSSEEKEEETDDPEWSPESSPVGKKYRRRSLRSSWRGGSVEDKKLRKKEQNKNAATRYRQKKKAEVYSILREEEALKEKKSKLEERVTDIQNEIRYLKGLMRELFKAKGIIN